MINRHLGKIDLKSKENEVHKSNRNLLQEETITTFVAENFFYCIA